MRRHADWMTQTDERVLEYLRENGNFPPSAIRDGLVEISEDIDYHQSHIGRRCRALDDHGLVENVGGGTYSITDLGKRYLDGEFDAGSLED